MSQASNIADQVLQKLADERKPSERANKLVAGLSQGIKGMGPAEMLGSGTLLMSPLVRHLVTSTKGFDPKLIPQDNEELQKLVGQLLPEKGTSENLRLEPMDRPGQAEYWRSYPWKKLDRQVLKLAPKSNPLTIAHEIGHAIQPNKFEKYLNITSGLARTPLATALPSILALTGGLGDSEEPNVAAKAAPYLGAAQLATIVGEETRANIRALKILKENKIPITTLQKLRQFVPSLSYLGRGALLVGGPLGILKGMDLYEKSRKTKYPFTFEQMLSMSPERLSNVPTPEELQSKWSDKV